MRPSLRVAAALGAAALALHQLRYLAGHGDQAGEALAREGHGYFALAAPLIAMLTALGLAELGLAWQRRQLPQGNTTLSRRWLGAALALIAIYAVQESLEGALVAGHPAGLAGLVGAGGWIALPLALALGLGVALLLRGADGLLARRGRPPVGRVLPVDAACPRPHTRRAAGTPLARHLAGRAPPPTGC